MDVMAQGKLIIGIHVAIGGFSERWIEYCESHKISYKIVDAYSNSIISDLEGCSIFMWHWNHNKYQDQLFARQLIYSLEQKGISVFPDYYTCWHFDDKVGQKYLLEAINAPLVDSIVFYNKESAMNWLETATFPKVFKLRGGAGSINVKLVESKRMARRIINKAFSKGFLVYDRKAILKDVFNAYKQKRDFKTALRVLKWSYYYFVPTNRDKLFPRQIGYVYFQEFMPNNLFDTRVVVVENKAFAIRRYTRGNDFRASGSGKIDYDPDLIDINCIKIGFNVAEKLKSKSVAYDFVYDNDGKPRIVEISYGYAVEAYDKCPGYWDKDLNWHGGIFKPQYWMVENIISRNKRDQVISEIGLNG